eukprot:Amastigsp_a174780_71.p3 type:complete len:118 gc:universal Amastigsp_a174780_71:271-624(+)
MKHAGSRASPPHGIVSTSAPVAMDHSCRVSDSRHEPVTMLSPQISMALPQMCGPCMSLIAFASRRSQTWSVSSHPPETRMFGSEGENRTQNTRDECPESRSPARPLRVWRTSFVASS